MLNRLKSSIVWQFAGGFVLGTIGLVALQPADATREMMSRIAPAAPLAAAAHEVR